MLYRSWASVALDTIQPAPTSPSRSESGIRTSVRKTSLNSAPPFIWRSGRTSTPVGMHVDGERGETGVLLRLGIGAGEQQRVARPLGAARPDLLTVHDPLVAVAHRPGGERGEIGAAARFAEELAPLGGAHEQSREVVLLLLFAAEREHDSGALPGTDRVGHPTTRGRTRRRQEVVDRVLQVDPASDPP